MFKYALRWDLSSLFPPLFQRPADTAVQNRTQFIHIGKRLALSGAVHRFRQSGDFSAIIRIYSVYTDNIAV